MQVILATRTEDRLNEVAEQADRIHEMSSRAIVAVTNAPKEKGTLEMQIQALTKQVAILATHLARGRTKEKSMDKRNRSRSRSQATNKEYNKSHCFYHNRFGEKAKKCTQPCTYKNSEKDQGSH